MGKYSTNRCATNCFPKIRSGEKNMDTDAGVVYYHRDHFAMGIMLGERLVLLGRVTKTIVETPFTDINDFPMPMRIFTKEARRAKRLGITRRQAEIHCPKPFTLTLKLLALLPRWVWAAMARRIIKS
jgi:hypothetical protein